MKSSVNTNPTRWDALVAAAILLLVLIPLTMMKRREAHAEY